MTKKPKLCQTWGVPIKRAVVNQGDIMKVVYTKSKEEGSR